MNDQNYLDDVTLLIHVILREEHSTDTTGWNGTSTSGRLLRDFNSRRISPLGIVQYTGPIRPTQLMADPMKGSLAALDGSGRDVI